MITATPEKVKTPQEGVIDGITTPETDHQALIGKVVQSMPQQQPPFTAEQAYPMTVAPVPASPELTQVGAHRVGSEELTLNEEIEIKHRDAKDLLKWFRNLIFGGASKIRYAPARLFLKFRRARLAAAGKADNKYDPSQSDKE